MADIGRIKLSQTQRTKIVAQNFETSPNVALSEINDVNTTGVANGYTLVYNTVSNKWEAKEIDAAGIAIDNITGGTF